VFFLLIFPAICTVIIIGLVIALALDALQRRKQKLPQIKVDLENGSESPEVGRSEGVSPPNDDRDSNQFAA
jgi:hypothetical protein